MSGEAFGWGLPGKYPQGVSSPGRGVSADVGTCTPLPPKQKGRQVAEPTRLPPLGQFTDTLRALVSSVKGM